MEYAIIDIETSGGDPKKDRITEIAIYRYNGTQVTDEFVSLVNPGVPIPPNIQRMTGITNEMVAEAPPFYEVAKRIVEITDGAVFVAHNVRFDYGFVQREFRNLGYTYTRKQLCTVQMSRRILPGMESYSLGKLCAQIGIRIGDRHRAYGDALATVKLFELLLQKDTGAKIETVVKEQIANVKLPPNISRAVVDNLPEETGVYYFHDERGEVMYVGKSTNIRSRVMSHFNEAKDVMRKGHMADMMHDISFELTGSELIALLLENEEIKRLQPRFNRAQRKTRFKYGLYVQPNDQNYLELALHPLNSEERPVASFPERSTAEHVLRRMVERHKLCPRLCNTATCSSDTSCLYQQIKLCSGAGVGLEGAEAYNVRVEAAIESISYGKPNFIVVTDGRGYGEKSVVMVEQGTYRGFAYVDEATVSYGVDDLRTAIKPRPETPDVQQIIRRYLRMGKKQLITW